MCSNFAQKCHLNYEIFERMLIMMVAAVLLIGDQLLYTDVENKTHTYDKGFICEYVVTTTTYGYRYGDCGLISATRSATSDTGHSCK